MLSETKMHLLMSLSAPDTLSSMKILIVEDDAATLDLVIRMIGRHGHDVIGCNSVEEAEKLMEEGRFDLLILDWMLPGKTGLEFCRSLREQERGDEYYILLMTARD